MRVALFALAVLIAATLSSAALGQVVRPDFGPQVQLQTMPPSLAGTWRVPIPPIASHDATLTLTPRANNRLTGVYNSISRNERFTCRGRFNRAKFALFCESDTLESVYTFYLVGEVQVVPATVTRGGGSNMPTRRILTGQLILPHLYVDVPPGHLVSIPFEGT